MPQQLHLDLLVPDLAVAVRRAKSLGANPAASGGAAFAVCTDPAGHPFCLRVHQQDEPIGVCSVALDCPDPAQLARFYAALLGMHVVHEAEDDARLIGDGENWRVYADPAGHPFCLVY